jgi:hypothetical protein
MGRRTKDRNHTPQKNNLIQDSEGNEENGYLHPDPNKAKINDTKKPSIAHKNNLKEEILQIITENFMEKILHVVNQNMHNTLKKFPDTENKGYEKTQK